MGQLVEGRWTDDDVRPTDASGAFLRTESAFRDWVTANGGPGPQGETGWPAAAGRYRLLVAPSCPWAHRAMIYRKLKGLEEIVPMALADAPKTAGWSFVQGFDEFSPGADGVLRLHQVYTAADPAYTGKVTVPTLWDRERKTIVNNESAEIIRMFNRAFDGVGANDVDLLPGALEAEIDAVNAFVYEHLNNGVYRAGFAKTQAAHEDAVARVFHGLDWLEERLQGRDFLAGDQATEADWRAFPTLLRFDLVYFGLFKCNIRPLWSYPNLRDYVRRLYRWPGVAETCMFDAIKEGYYAAMPGLNPNGIIPVGPDMAWLTD